MEQDIKHIIQDAIYAPSGENCQPWSFKISGNTINLFNLPERDQSLYNQAQYGSYVSHGALLENVKISALELGYFATIKIFPAPSNNDHIATIVLEKTKAPKSPFYEMITKRVTNRKIYKNEPLSNIKLNELEENVGENDVEVILTQNESDKKILAAIGGANESIMMSNKFLHNFFFSHVTWTKEEDMAKKVGFFIDTLELPPPAEKIFKILRNWKTTNFLNKLGLYKMVGKQNAATYASSAGFGVIQVKNISPENFVRAGMVLERFWLKVTKLGLSFQPVSGLLFLYRASNSGQSNEFTISQKERIKSGYKEIKKIFSVEEGKDVVFMFRFGYSERPTARSSRFNVEDFIKK